MTVVVTRVYAFACNACDSASDEVISGTMQGAWTVIARDGWVREGVDRHLCPAHATVEIDTVVDDR